MFMEKEYIELINDIFGVDLKNEDADLFKKEFQENLKKL